MRTANGHRDFQPLTESTENSESSNILKWMKPCIQALKDRLKVNGESLLARVSSLVLASKSSPLCPDKALSGPPASAGTFRRSDDIYYFFFSEPSVGSSEPRARRGGAGERYLSCGTNTQIELYSGKRLCYQERSK